MAAGDATPFPRKNTAYRVTFPILDADGDLVTGASGLDSEVSKDAGTFADCTNEATEIATSSGVYYLDLTSTEMNADTVAIIVKTSTSGAKTTVITLYPVESTDIDVNVTAFGGTAGTFSGGRPEVNSTHWGGTAVASAVVSANTIQISGDSGAADNAESFFDGTGYAGTNNVIPTVTTATNVTTVNGLASGVITATSIAADAITAAKIADGAIDANTFASGAITSTAIAADAIGASELASDAVAEIADAVWDEVLSGHLTAGSTGNALNAAGSAGDPWSTSLPGSYGSGTAGYIVGNNADSSGVTSLLSRLTSTRAGYIDNLSGGAVALQSTLTTLQTTVGAAGAGLTALAPAATALSTAQWTNTRAGYLDNLSGGAVPTAAGIWDLADGIETGLTPRQAFRITTAALCGKASGMATTTATLRNTADTKNRIVATVDADGNRSAVTLDLT